MRTRLQTELDDREFMQRYPRAWLDDVDEWLRWGGVDLTKYLKQARQLGDRLARERGLVMALEERDGDEVVRYYLRPGSMNWYRLPILQRIRARLGMANLKPQKKVW